MGRTGSGRLPLHVVVTGVSGTGKSAVGRGLAARLGVRLVEADEHHPEANVAKMSSGTPLTDSDRIPWLQGLARILAADDAAGRPSVLACSALRRAYRDVLRGGLPEEALFFVQLHAERELLEARMQQREHFMPVALLHSQLGTLEPLAPDENGARVNAALPLEEVIDAAIASLPLGR